MTGEETASSIGRHTLLKPPDREHRRALTADGAPAMLRTMCNLYATRLSRDEGQSLFALQRPAEAATAVLLPVEEEAA